MSADQVQHIPPSQVRTCSMCGARIDSNGRNTYRQAVGWFRNRPGKGGGANAIALPQWRERFACLDCIDRTKHRIAIGQMTIFDMASDDDD